jgi:transforming growth factor-beta-induced protein
MNTRFSGVRTRRRGRTAGLAQAALLTVFAQFLSGCSDSSEPAGPDATGNLVEVAAEAGIFSTLIVAAEAAGVVPVLAEGGPFTLFAPTDEAFAGIPASAIERLLADPELLTRVLTYHLVPGTLDAGAVTGATSLTTVNGASLSVRIEGGTAFVDDAAILQTDIQASNGIIHVIDGVLLPEPVLDLVETALVADDFETLTTLVEAAGLIGALQGEGPFTVFAPTDAAFAALDEELVAALLADPELLASVLLYHVVEGAVLAEAVVGLTEVTTLSGETIAISFDGETVRLNGVPVVATDVVASNGVIHVLGGVLLPPEG